MKNALKISLAVLLLLLGAGFVGYFYNFNAIKSALAGSDRNNLQSKLKYHFTVISQDTDSDFWQSLERGAQKAGNELGAAIEFIGTLILDEDEELEYLKIATASRVDGIAIFVTDDTKFAPAINDAVSQGIPVVTIESDDRSSKRSAFIGPNSFSAGLNSGTLVAEATNGSANVALILSGNYRGDTDAEYTLLSGFKFGISSYPGIRLQTIRTPDSGYFGAEKIIRDIISNNPEINTVVCTSSDDTLEVTQVLIDLNKVGKITVIGYNNVSQIREYIKNDVIYGTVVEDPENTGYQCIKALVGIREGQKVDDFIDTGVYNVTRSNILKYPGNS